MNSYALETHSRPTLAQLWAVLKEFHTGDFLRELFDKHHLKLASVGRRMGTTGQNISGMFKRAHIHDETLVRLGEAAGMDILSMVRKEKLRLQGVDLSQVAEPSPTYGRPSAVDVVVHMDDYDETTQLKILRFIQQLPKRR